MQFIELLAFGNDHEPSDWKSLDSSDSVHTLVLDGAGDAIVDVEIAMDEGGERVRHFFSLRGHTGETAIRQLNGPLRYRCVRRRGNESSSQVTAIAPSRK